MEFVWLIFIFWGLFIWTIYDMVKKAFRPYNELVERQKVEARLKAAEEAKAKAKTKAKAETTTKTIATTPNKIKVKKD
ncbi:MAG: hypothetical protein PHY11_02085 [Bacilli bacterium]|jgi:hypothetical protein|nr:hypothetical protein [Bacilli bacterium]MDD3422348.1 hypothetical protein [Bacilli bacterium]MDD4065772.1 hypothetical protein [Bacilli bacterium]